MKNTTKRTSPVRITPRRKIYSDRDRVYINGTYHTTNFSVADSEVTVSISQRGEQHPDGPFRDVEIEFARIHADGKRTGGSVTLTCGEEVKLLMDLLKDNFNDDGTAKGPVESIEYALIPTSLK